MIQQDGQVNVGTSVISDTRLLLRGSKDCITSAIFCYGEAPDKVSKAARKDVPMRQVDAHHADDLQEYGHVKTSMAEVHHADDQQEHQHVIQSVQMRNLNQVCA